MLPQPRSDKSSRRRRITSALALCSMLLTSLAGWATPPSFTANYTLFTRGFEVAKVERRFVNGPGNRYDLQTTSRPSGAALAMFAGELVEKSTGVIDDTNFLPDTYTYKRAGFQPKSIQARYDWDNRTLDIATVDKKKGEREWQVPLVDGLTDKHIYHVAMMRDLGAGKRTVEYKIADKYRVKTYRFQVVAEEKLETALGTLDVWKLIRTNEKNGRKTTFWSAPSLDYLTVRLEQEKDGVLTYGVLESVVGLQ